MSGGACALCGAFQDDDSECRGCEALDADPAANCERCSEYLSEEDDEAGLGLCSACLALDREHEREDREVSDGMEDFYAWGGWRRAFAEGDDDPGPVCGTDFCGGGR